MSRFEEKLSAFAEILLEKNPDSFVLYQPALTTKEVELSFNEMNVTDTNLLALYNWRNGIQQFESLNKEKIFEFGNLISLDIVKDMYSRIDDFYDFDSKELIPIIGNSAGDVLFFNNNRGKDYGKIHLYCVSLLYIENPVSIFDSLDLMIEMHIYLYKEGLMFYDKTGFGILYDQYLDVGRKLNINSEYWL
jgi:hypothetical protein